MLKVKGRKTAQASTNQKKTEVVLLSDQGFRANTMVRDKEGHFRIIKELRH